MRKNKGFTLIEVLIVLVVLSLLVMGSLVVLNRYRGGAKEDEEARNNVKAAYGLVQECFGRNESYEDCEMVLDTYATAIDAAGWDGINYCFYAVMGTTNGTTRYLYVSDSKENGIISTVDPATVATVNSAPCQ